MIPNLQKILKEWSYRVGVIKPNDEAHLFQLQTILTNEGWPIGAINEFIGNLTEVKKLKKVPKKDYDILYRIGMDKYKDEIINVYNGISTFALPNNSPVFAINEGRNFLGISTNPLGIGSTGSITGIGRRLKEVFKHVTIIGIRPEVWPGIEGLKPLGSPEDIVPAIYDDTVVDQWIDITADEAKNWANMVAKKGFFVGQSSGANLAGISEVIKNLSDGIIVTLLNDFGERYFSTGLWS